MPHDSLLDYHGHLQALVITSKVAEAIHIVPKVTPRNKLMGGIIGRITFPDGGIIQFTEEVVINKSGEMTLDSYSYTYEAPDGFYFRYEMDSEAAYNNEDEPILVHPECHLHANSEEPRYITHKTNFREIFEFVVACNYSEDKK